MKFKFCVLTMLVVGLVLGLSGSAFAVASGVLELNAQDDATYTFDAPAVDIAGIPALIFKIDNTGTTDETVDAIVLTNGAGTTIDTAGDFLANIYLDADGNGVLSEGDSQLNTTTNADVAVATGAAAKTTITLDTGLVITSLSEAYLIVTVTADFAGGTTVDGDDVEFVLVLADALDGYSVAPTASATGTLDPTLAANVPTITVTAGAGTITGSAHPSATPWPDVGSMPNKETDHVAAGFTVTADGAVSHVIETISLTHTYNGVAADFDEIKIYIDANSDGAVDVDDIELATEAATDMLDAATTVADLYNLDFPLFVPASGVVRLLVTVTGVGTGTEGETITSALTPASCVIDGGAAFAAGAAAGGTQTIRALLVAATTKDFVGHSYNSSRPNGYLDAAELVFTHNPGAVVTPINDATVIASEFTIKDGGGVAYSNSAFTSTYQGDAVNDDKIYIKHTEKIHIVNSSTVSTGTFDYSGTTKVTSLSGDGEYALVAIAGGTVNDGAGPAPISITTSDDDNDGLTDLLSIQFSEALAGTGADPDDVDVITVAGHTATNIAVDCLLDDAAPEAGWGANTILTISLDEDPDEDSSETPDVSFAGAADVLEDGGGNDVVAWSAVHLNVVDGAVPTLVKVTTKDADVDGHLDALVLKFSEPVTVGSESDLLTDLDFAGGYEANYSFTSGVTGSGTTTITVPVTPRAKYDSGVKPLISYGDAESTLKDASGKEVAAITIIIPVTTVTSADEVVLEDGIKPVVAIAETHDGSTPNGKIDGYKLIFSEEMESTVANYNSIKVGGSLITQDAAVIIADTVWVSFDEIESGYDTDATPEITYTIGLADGDTTITDANGVMLDGISSGTVVETDEAAPLIVKAKIRDIGYGKWVSDDVPKAANAQIDAIEITFSEPVDTTEVQYDETALSDLIDEFEFTAFYTVGDTLCSFADDMKSMIIPIVELVDNPDTDLGDFNSELVYTAKGDAKLKDEAGILVPDVVGDDTAPNVTESDGAPPVPIAANTIDDNNDGFLDGVEFVFSEAPVIGEDDSAMAQENVALEELSNAIDLSSAVITGGGDAIKFVGISEMGAEKWDTSKLPMAYIGDGSGIEDSSGNEVVATVDSVETTDTAAPVLAKAVGQKESKTILVTFSEEVTDEGASLLAVGDIKYINIFDEDNPTAIAGIVSDDDPDPSDGWTLTTDNTLTSDHVTEDKLAVVDGLIWDIATTPNKAYLDTVAIADPSAPTLSKAETVDANGDGRIDNLKLTFSENIKDANIRGYKAPKDTTVAWTSSTGDRWTAGDYTVLGVNFTCSDDAAAVATSEQIAALRTNPAKPVYNVDDVANDNIIYLALKLGDEPDTDARPVLSMVGDNLTMGSGVGDFSGNAAVSISEVTPKDKVGPVIISAEMTTSTVMTIIMSEEINDDDDYAKEETYPKAAVVFTWKVGSQEKEWIGNVIHFKEPVDGTMTLEIVEAFAIPPGMPSTIAFAAADVLEDDRDAVTNSNGPDETVAVTPPVVDPDEVAEDALPDAYALSKNFPNPFNPTTTIQYAIPADGAGHVELVIYNINGQKVRTLVNGTADAGFYSVMWDGRNDVGEAVSSGIYLYRIVSGSFVKIEKMTFMK